MNRWILILIALAISMYGLTACSSGNNTGDTEVEETREPDPVTLMLYPHQPITADHFQLLIANPVKEKYPHITVERMDRNAVTIDNLVASGVQVDLFTMWNGNINPNKELGIFEDVGPLLRQAQFDLGRFDQEALDTLRLLSDRGELYGLPYNMQFNALYYNEDIFDKFGVEYPADGLTWDEVVELVKRLTRTEGNVQYSGLGMDSWTRVTYPLSLVPVDAKTNRAAMNSDLYRRAFTLGKQIFIPGNEMELTTNIFIREKRQAMLASVNQLDLLSGTPDLNWDIAQFPSYADNPNVYGMYDLHVILISSTSRHKTEAMKVLEVFFSDEIQTISTSQTGRVSLLTNPDIRRQFGSSNPVLAEKRLDSIFKSRPAPAPPFSKFQSKGSEITVKYYREFLADNMDLNTALRSAEEELNQFIQSQE